MATTTLTTPAGDTNFEKDEEKYARIVKIIRNMTDCKRNEDRKVVVPVRTATNPSPAKKAASNRHPGQTHTRTEVGDALNHELATARYLMHDLVDHVFGHIVSTELAKDILQHFAENKVVQVFEEAGTPRMKIPLDPESDDARRAVEQAFEIADYYDCIPRDTQNYGMEPRSSSTNTKGKRKAKAKRYSFGWIKFPTEPLREDDLVTFLNDMTDRAFAFAKPKLAVSIPELRHRFAAPEDKYHAIPLSYEPDGEDMRPDFLLLPTEAFSNDFKTVDPKYVNFTVSRLVGESKNKDLAAGLEQLERYARGLRRAQPWVYYVLGLTVTKDKAVLLRGEGSGTERLELVLSDGRGCIEFIRILHGLALADKVELGHNPAVVLEGKEQACKATNVTRQSNATSSRPQPQAFTMPNPVSRLKSKAPIATQANSDTSTYIARTEPSSSTKRAFSAIGGDGEGTKAKKRKTGQNAAEDVDRFVFYPIAVYGHKCLGILFTASSIRGRGTTVFCVVDLEDGEKLLVLKMSWQDIARVAEQDEVMDCLKSHESHPNLIVPLKTYKVERDGELCTTLGALRGFLDEQIEILGVENRVLTTSVSELKRPVKYFWGVHDFVRGLRGALLGHEYLSKIGILHRDISENNIVLGLRPDDERGYLIDFDMAILQDAESHTQAEPVVPVDPLADSGSDSSSECASQKSSEEAYLLQSDDKRHVKALRTGTFPYMSYNVLLGGRHTHFDDVESFLYVLLLFFFSYAGPLSVSELHKADETGFVHPIGSGRHSHIRNWPPRYADWADGKAEEIGDKKYSAISMANGVKRIIGSTEFLDCLKNNWPAELRLPITRLIEASFIIFHTSTLRTVANGSRTEVSHTEFIRVLDKWLKKYARLEEEFSNCPFKQAPETKSM